MSADVTGTVQGGTIAPVRPSVLVAWFAIALLLVYLVLIGGAYGGIYAAPIRATTVLLAAAALATWAIAAWRAPARRRLTSFWPCLALAIAALAASTLASGSPRIGLDYVAYAVILAALYALLVALLAQETFRTRLSGLVVILCLSVSGIYLITVMSVWIEWWTLVGRTTMPPLRPAFEGLTYGNPSAAMTMSLLLLAPAVAHVGFDSVRRSALSVTLVVLASLVTIVSGSRAGWLGLALGLAITAMAWVGVSSNRVALRRVVQRPVFWAALVPIAAVAMLGAVVFGPGLLLRAGAGGEAVRSGFYAASVRMFAESPLLGQGPGTWPMRRIAFTAPTETDYYIPHAHNVYLQTVAELGIVGVAIGILIFVVLVRLIWRGLHDANPLRRRFAWAALFSTAYFGAHQLLDFYPNMPAFLFAFAFPIAWLDATDPMPMFRRRLSPAVKGLAVLSATVLVGAAVLWALYSDRAGTMNLQAVRLANEDRWHEALPIARSMVEADPAMPPYQFTLGLAEAWAGDARRAEHALGRAAAADGMPVVWLDLAKLRLDRGDRAGGVAALEEALRLGVQQPSVAINASLMWEQMGDHAKASALLAAGLKVMPTLAGDPFWRDEPSRARLMTDAIAIASDQDPALALALALHGDDLDAASRLVEEQATPEAREFAGLLVRAWRGDDGAAETLYRLATEHPLDPSIIEWCTRLAVRQGDRAAAERFLRWAVIIEGPEGTGAGVVRSHIEPIQPRSVTGTPGFYGLYTYRQMTPWDQIVPGMVRLTTGLD
jgi:O-antigen ligase